MPSRKANNDPSQPGPGTYTSSLYSVGTEGRKFAFQGRTNNTNGKYSLHNLNFAKEPLHQNIKKNSPGPGAYGYGIEINKYGIYKLSTVGNSRAAAWSPSKKRFIDDLRHKRDIPGPGDYHPSDQINGSGQYLLSNFKSYGTRKYMPDSTLSSRGPAPLKSETPGPGSYQAPSDFGYLVMDRTSPRTPVSPRRQSNTANILSSRGAARRTSLMSHRNSNS
jgi:hypothetical protein